MVGSLPGSNYNNPPNYTPKAYLVWMLFDSEFNLVKTGNSSGIQQIPNGADQRQFMAQNDITMDKSGFFYAYVLNESPMNVYFDDFQVSTTSGQVLEENNYYPFGMLNAQLSAPGITDPINNYKYNGKELQKELSLQWLDYGARFYDPQIGRWTTPDPLSEVNRKWSPYRYGYDNPIRFIDPDGMLEIVKPKDQEALTTIKNTLTEEDAKYVNLDKNGNIDLSSMESHKSESENYNNLKEMAASPKTMEVSVADNFDYKDENGKIQNQKLPTTYVDKNESSGGMDPQTGEHGYMAQTQTPGNQPNKYNSPDDNIKVIVNKSLSNEGRAQIYSHEANGHVLLYMRGENYKHTTVGNSTVETNTKLYGNILRSINETIKNMKERNN